MGCNMTVKSNFYTPLGLHLIRVEEWMTTQPMTEDCLTVIDEFVVWVCKLSSFGPLSVLTSDKAYFYLSGKWDWIKLILSFT